MKRKAVQAEELDITDLVENPENAREHTPRSISTIVESVQYAGVGRSGLMDEKNTLIAGHGTKDALIEAGIRKVIAIDVKGDEWLVVRRKGLTKAQKRVLAISDNRATELSHFKPELLQAQLAALEGKIGLGKIGFEPSDLTKLKILIGADDEEDDETIDEVPEPHGTSIKSGDVFTLGRHRLMCGSADKKPHIEKLLAGARAQVILTDPPYGVSVVKDGMVGADFGVAKKGRYAPMVGDEEPANVKPLFAYADGIVLWGGNYFADQLSVSPSWFVWDKRVDSGIENTFADCEMAWTNLGGPARIYRQLWNGMIREGEHSKRIHPTQKPVALFRWCLERAGNPSVVADFYAGSGTCLIAAERSGAQCYAMEIDPSYVQAIIERWQTLTGQEAVKVVAA